MLTIEIRNVHNYIYNIDISTLKGIQIAFSESRVGGNQILLHCILLEQHQNHSRTDLADNSRIYNKVHSDRHGSSSSPPPPHDSHKLFCQVRAINCQSQPWGKLCHHTGKDIFSYHQIMPAFLPVQTGT